MTTFDEITSEKSRIAERLLKLDDERVRLGAALSDLEAAERVLSRFASPGATAPRRRGRPAPATNSAAEASPASTASRRGRRPANGDDSPSIGDLALQAVQDRPEGISAGEILGVLAYKHGLTVRANHLGIALSRHAKAGRVTTDGHDWFPALAQGDIEPAAIA